MSLYYTPQVQEQDSSGDPLAGAKLYYYEPGTTTLKDVYQDAGFVTAHTNPVVADAAGRFDPIYLNGSYKVKLTDSDDTEIWTEDNISAGTSSDFFATTTSISTTTQIDSTYDRQHLRLSGDIDLTFEAAATLGAGFMITLQNDGTNSITLDPNSSEQINGATTIEVAPRGGGILLCNGASFSFIGQETRNTWSKGADIASATALTLGDDGNYFDVTGTTAIETISTTGYVGTVIKLHFDGVLTLTHDATDLILPTGANITTAAGDEAEFIEYASGDYRCTNYQRADGSVLGDLPLAQIASGTANRLIGYDGSGDPTEVTVSQNLTLSGGALTGAAAASTSTAGVVEKATQAEIEAETADVYADCNDMFYHPGIAKAAVYVTYSGGTPSANGSYNISSLTDTAVGNVTINTSITFSATSTMKVLSIPITGPGNEVNHYESSSNARSTTSVTIHTNTGSSQTATDADSSTVILGDV